ncbi:MAG: Fur family transcriptional regulator [Steroidobacteraceae bacterium]
MMVSSTNPVADRLRQCGIQPTAQRVQIAQILLSAPQHLTAEQILANLQSLGARVSKATVYNTLNLFAARGVIRQLATDGERAWFDSNTSPHFHFQDADSGALIDLDPQEVRFERLPPPPAGTEYAGIELFIRLRRV